MERRRENERTPVDFFPLSYSQQNIWNLESAHPGLPMNNICTALKIEGNLNIEYLQRCIELAYKAFPTLRLRITVRDGRPCQYISEEIPWRAEFFDFTGTNEQGIDTWYQSVAREHFTLCDSPLCQMLIFKRSDSSGGILTRVHHIVADAWSHALVTNHIIYNYFQLLQDKETQCQIAPDYRLHIESEQKYRQSKVYQRDRDYWKEQLRDILPALAKEHQCAHISPVGLRRSYPLPGRLNRMIARYCQQEKVSPFAVFYMALAIYLRRVRGQARFCIGVPTINRLNYKEKQSGGMFVNTLPFVNELDTASTWNEFNDKLKDDWFHLLYHQRLPFEDIKKLANTGNEVASDQLFEIALSYQNGKMEHLRGARVTLEGRWMYCGYQSETLCIHLSSRDASNQFVVDYDYLTQIFSASEIDALHGRLVKILKEALKNPDLPVGELPILEEEEEERVIFDFNKTNAWYDRNAGIGTGLLEAARENEGKIALICRGKRISYEQLMNDAARIAGGIRQFLPEGRHTVALLSRREEGLLAALCGIILSGNSWVLMDPAQPQRRIADLLKDSQAALCITDDSLAWAGTDIATRTLKELHGSQKIEILPPEEKPSDLAYLVYTSGTTGSAKAVEVEQHSVMNLKEAIKDLYPKGAVLSICNVGFDAFLLESVIALLNGATIVMATEEEMNDAQKMGRLIMDYDVGFMALTPSRLKAYQNDQVFLRSLSHIETLICGGEVLVPDTYLKLRDYTPATLYNQYGPSEATVAVSHAAVDGKGPVTIGRPLANCRIYILDENRNALPVGSAGELYIGGECLARGYHNREELTRERFVEDPFMEGQRMYRTGDIGKWTEDGSILYLGRNDSQVKLLGHRIELAEVESVLGRHPLVNAVAVTVYENQLIAYYMAKEGLEGEALLSYGALYLPRYLQPVYAARVEELPVTGNGKIDVGRLPKPELPDMEEAPADEWEEKILAIWQRILEKPGLGIHSDYFLSGGDSLNAVFMLTETEKEFGKVIQIQDLYANSTVRRFACLLRGAGIEDSILKGRRIPKARERGWYPPTPVQSGFFVMHSQDATKVGYNMPAAFKASAWLDFGRLEQAAARMIEEDELLRTQFEMQEGKLIARVSSQADFQLEWMECGRIEEAMERFVRPFDLGKAPLFRAAMVKAEGNEPYIIIDMHHIISDGISSQIIFERLHDYYCQKEVHLPELSYVDFAWWVNENMETAGVKCREYWKKILPEKIPKSAFVPDRPRPSEFDGAGGRYGFELPEELDESLKMYCKDKKITPYMFLLGVFAMMQGRFACENTAAIGSPFSGRRNPGLEKMTGVFVNTLPIFLDVKGGQTIEDYFGKVRKMVAGIQDYQDISLEEIIGLAHEQRQQGRNPLYSTLFSLTPVSRLTTVLGEAELSYVPYDTHSVKIDLHLEATCIDGHYRFAMEYAACLFDEVTAAFYGRCLIQGIRAVLNGGVSMVGDIPWLGYEDRLRLVEQPNRMRTPYDCATVDQAMDDMAYLMPDKRAVEWGEGRHYTFRQLKERSDNLAAMLLVKGVLPGDKAAFLTRRNGDMLVMMFGILKAGAAYVPVDPAFPKERIRYMLRQADVKVAVYDRETEPFEDIPCQVLRYEGPQEVTRTALPVNSPEDVANVIFTSGSTGKPKGVMMLHKSLSNLMAHLDPLLGGQEQKILCASNCVFDVFTTETILASAKGHGISIADEEEMMLPWKMAERIRTDKVSILQLTPSRILMCMNDESFCKALADIQIIILLGEPWTMELKDRLCALTEARIFNIYGPTETSVHNCQGEIRMERSIHIGKPIGNCRYYLLDEEKKPVLPTSVGEIYIAGECLSAGYINQPELTSEVFVPDIQNPKEKMYKTGDRGRQRADGNWQCIGRVDTQLKLNGHRIEPVEIATVMLQSGLAKEAAVVPIMKDGIPRFLRGAVVPKKEYQEKELRAYLKDRLPDYMLPSEIILLDELPRTASGKTDLKLLAAMEKKEKVWEALPAANQEACETMEVTEEGALTAIWSEVLGKDPDPEVSFFQQGGTSLTAIIILNQYHQRQLAFSINDFYHYPSLREQIDRLCKRQEGIEEKKAAGNIPELARLPRYLPEVKSIPVKEGAALVTGATGYLGSYLVKELADAGKKACCLVRGDEKRLFDSLRWHFGPEFCREHQHLLIPVVGSLTQEHFGLDDENFARLADEVAVVYHCAADVRHFAPEDELLKTNVTGTKRAIEFAREARASYMHISTVSVAGEYLLDAPQAKAIFEEQDLDVGQNWMENPYAMSKMLAEYEVTKAQEEGLAARIFRVGRVVCNSYSGKFQKNQESNAYYRLIKGLLEFGKMPEELRDTGLETTYVDLAAKAIVGLSEETGGAFHIFNPKEISIREILDACGEIQTVGRREFERELEIAGTSSDSPYVQAFAQSWFSGELAASHMIMDCRRTREALAKIGFYWPKPDPEILKICFMESRGE